ncbi:MULTISPECIES: cardiolipin synthase [unclassified Dietzia]|uniref:cardiolipin synthase n=1 Tax=unclassified Dietzia TaxID=2617939 RepID=UPI000D21B0F4|nr:MULTISPECIES: cardiolipin synthase [unclassified Dietzia]AVZ38316.1 cardiolipin synthase [Dietzia sp. JS16-p6b]
MNPVVERLAFLPFPAGVTSALLITEYALKILALGMVPENRQPASSQAWLLVILFIPIVGVPLFLLLGNPYITGRRHIIQAEANRLYEEALEDQPTVPDSVRVDPGVRTILEMNRTLTAIPCMSGDFVALHSDYSASLAAMTAAVRSARDHVHIEFYAQSWDDETDDFFDAAVEAAERGVAVRVLVDHLGSLRYRGFALLRRRLRRTPVELHLMLPINPFVGRFRRPDLRNHRKMLIVDGDRGFIGSQNLIARNYGSPRNARLGREWVDLMMEVRGEIVRAMDGVFLVDWYSECGEVIGTLEELSRGLPVAAGRPTGDPTAGDPVSAFQLVPSGPGYRTQPNLRMFTQLIGQAEHRIRIVSPYFVPDEALLHAVTSAAFRGVDVELFVPEHADQFLVHHAQRSYFRALLEAGVRINRFRSPAVLHTKMLLIDDFTGVVGSSNMDQRSFNLNFEISLLVLGGEAVAEMNEAVDAYLEDSTSLDLETWQRRPWPGRYVDNVARLSSALQ